MATSVVQKIANAGGVGIPVSLTTSTGATTTEGILLGTTETATAGAQKWSPAIHFQGSGWKTNATAAAQSVDLKMELVPVEGASAPGYNFNFMSSINGGAYATRLTIGDLGIVQIPAATGILMDGANSQFRIDCPAKLFCLGNTFVLGFSTGSVAAADTGLSRISAGVVGVGTGGATSAAGVIMATSHMRVPLTVATLPAGATRGYTCIVTDASNPTFLATVAGGASTVTPVFYDGAAWKVG